MKIHVDSMLWLRPEDGDDAATIRRLQRKYTYTNPAFSSAKEMGTSTRGIDPEFHLWQERDGCVGIPRTAGLREFSGHPMDDLRASGRETNVLHERLLEFRTGQADAVQAVVDALVHGEGTTLQAPCGSGKTVLGVEVIRILGRSTAVLVHKDFLANQWEAEINTFLPKAKVGRIQRDHVDSGETHDVVICMIQSLLSRSYPDEVLRSFGVVVCDEVHRHSAHEWHRAAVMFPARYRLGLTATPDRRDGLSDVFLANIGPICHRMKAERLRPRLEVRYTNFDAPFCMYSAYRAGGQLKPNIPKLLNLLAKNKPRTELILRDVLGACLAGRRPIVLTHRLEHVDVILGALRGAGIDARILVGGMTEEKQVEATMGDLIVATYQMAAEGLDVPEYDTLFLATPQASIEQAVGRILRVEEDKKQPLVVDYVDSKIGICVGMFRSRSRTYARLGVEVRRGN